MGLFDFLKLPENKPKEIGKQDYANRYVATSSNAKNDVEAESRKTISTYTLFPDPLLIMKLGLKNGLYPSGPIFYTDFGTYVKPILTDFLRDYKLSFAYSSGIDGDGNSVVTLTIEDFEQIGENGLKIIERENSPAYLLQDNLQKKDEIIRSLTEEVITLRAGSPPPLPDKLAPVGFHGFSEEEYMPYTIEDNLHDFIK